MITPYVTIIDPPSGHLYGFPRALDLHDGETIRQWLVRNGYPEHELDFAMKYLRSWTQPKDNNDL